MGLTVDVKPTDDGCMLSCRHGRARIRVLAPGLMYSSIEGLAPEGYVDPVIEQLEEWIGQGLDLTVAVDATRMRGYEAGYRKRLVQWLAAHRGQLVGVHVLFRSRIIGMGVQLAGRVLLDTLTAYSDRARFVSAVDRDRDRRLKAAGEQAAG